MRVIIAGSRDLSWADTCLAIEQCPFNITEVVSGCARGPDRYGEQFADSNAIPIMRFPANWELFKQAAGIVRNVEMAKYADCLLAIWDGESKGTKHMIDIMTKEGKPVYVYRTDESK